MDGEKQQDEKSGLKQPRRRNAERTKKNILTAAREEFCDQGLKGARLDAIAEAAHVDKKLLYYYFNNREELYLEVLHEAYRSIRVREQELNIRQYEPLEAIDRLVRFTFRHFLENPWFPRLMAVENMENARFVELLKDHEDIRSPIVEDLVQVLHTGIETGVFRRGVDPMQLYISIVGLCYFYVSNMKTMSVVFQRDLSAFSFVQDRESQAAQMVLDYLRTMR